MAGRRARETYERTVEAMANRHPGVGLADVATAQARCDQHRADRTPLSRGLATGLVTRTQPGG